MSCITLEKKRKKKEFQIKHDLFVLLISSEKKRVFLLFLGAVKSLLRALIFI